MPFHIVAKDQSHNILGVAPLYLKRFSFLFLINNQAHYVLLFSSLVICVTAIPTVNLFLITLGLMHTAVLAEDIILNSSAVFLSPQLPAPGF